MPARFRRFALLATLLVIAGGCARDSQGSQTSGTTATTGHANSAAPAKTTTGEKAMAYFAGGCFWCVEADFDKLPGVYEVISGYSGGDSQYPTYKQVTFTETGHYEAVEVIYDPTVVTYRALVDFHFRHVDPTDDGGQFCDRGSSYKSAIFVRSPEERAAAQSSKAEAQSVLGQPIVTPILDYRKFWIAEDYHQDYYIKNPVRYRYYRTGCGRDRTVAALWGEQAASRP